MAKTKGKTANIFVWIILGLLVIGLAGFGVDGFGGSVRSVGQVGDREIRVQDYARALRLEMRSMEQQLGRGLSLQQAQEMGLDRAVLAQLVTVAALENEAMRLGISVGDGTVRDELLAIPAFLGLDGQFNREAYRFTLQQEGWSEREFEDRIRMEMARSILQTGAVAAAPAPPVFADTVLAWFGEQRDVEVLRIDRSALDAPVPVPGDAELRAFHAENPDLFTLPEARRIAYAWITPGMLADEVEIDEGALREAYNLRSAEFIRPERRLVERLVFASEADAQAARDRIDAGEAGFEEIVAERGLAMEDTDMGDVTEADLGAAGADVFALDGPGLAGPLPSPFGPALYNVVAVLAAQETPFEEALPELREQLAMDRARRMISDLFDDYEDILAGGATLEELAAETRLEFGTIDLRPGTDDGIAAYESFRSAARAVTERDFTEMAALDDGGVFALRLDGTVPPEVQPFEAVEVQVIDAWDSAEAARRVAARAEEVLAALETGTTPDALGLRPEPFEAVTRVERLPGLPRAAIEAAFELSVGDRRMVTDGPVAHIVTLTGVRPADTDSPEAQADRRAIVEELRASLAQDIFTAWAGQLEREAGIRIDDSAVQAVHAQFR